MTTRPRLSILFVVMAINILLSCPYVHAVCRLQSSVIDETYFQAGSSAATDSACCQEAKDYTVNEKYLFSTAGLVHVKPGVRAEAEKISENIAAANIALVGDMAGLDEFSGVVWNYGVSRCECVSARVSGGLCQAELDCQFTYQTDEPNVPANCRQLFSNPGPGSGYPPPLNTGGGGGGLAFADARGVCACLPYNDNCKTYSGTPSECFLGGRRQSCRVSDSCSRGRPFYAYGNYYGKFLCC